MTNSIAKYQLSTQLKTFAQMDDVLLGNIITHYVHLIDDNKFVALAEDCLNRELELEQLSNQA